MKHVRSFLLLVVLTMSVRVSAQVCGTLPPSPGLYAHTRDVIANIDVTAFRNAGTTCIPIQAQVVRLNDGTGGITQQQMNVGLSFLNYVYLDAGIEFFWKGPPNTANSTTYYDYDETAGDTETGLAALFTTATDAVNVYFVGSAVVTGGIQIAGYAYFPFNSAQSNRVLMVNTSAYSVPQGTFCHEFGHYFNLFHTHEATEFGNADPNAENVPRVGGQANCSTDGDLLCDTQADPRYASAQFNQATCTYTGGGTDINGVAYTPPVDNIMSYYPDDCGGLFTAQQYTRIAQGLVTRLGHSAYALNATPASVLPATGLAATQVGSAVQLDWTDVAANDRGYIVERSTTSSSAGFRALPYAATAVSGITYTDNTIQSSTTYWYRVKATNGSCNTYSNVATITTGLSYCTPTYTAGCGTSPVADFIFNGTSTISNINSGCSAASYGNYTAMVANVTAGAGYAVTAHGVTTGFGTYSPRYIAIYGDWNHDGDFVDAGESMLAANTPMAPTYSGTITIPATALNGATRLRVRCWDQVNGCAQSPCTACNGFGEAEDYTLNVSGGASPNVQVAMRVMLQGPYDTNTLRMKDDLRVAAIVPAGEPYTALGFTQAAGGGGETVSGAVLAVTGVNAIVDWVLLELRSGANSSTIVATKCALVQADGDVVSAVDGTSAVTFGAPAGSYFVAVRHRNHFGCMTLASMALTSAPAVVDFTLPATNTFGTNARRTIGSVMALWAGNTVRDTQIKYSGGSNDRDPILTAIGGTVTSSTLAGYLMTDVNLSGVVKYSGTSNDRDVVLLNIGGTVLSNTITEQLP